MGFLGGLSKENKQTIKIEMDDRYFSDMTIHEESYDNRNSYENEDRMYDTTAKNKLITEECYVKAKNYFSTVFAPGKNINESIDYLKTIIEKNIQNGSITSEDVKTIENFVVNIDLNMFERFYNSSDYEKFKKNTNAFRELIAYTKIHLNKGLTL